MLRPIQGMFNPADYPDLMVGLGDPDDAAVWRLDAERALVVTTDFFTPVVDDPYDYGAIAAANALSDVYAMGGKPFLALNVAAFPPDLPPEITGEILRGGAEMARQAGVVLAGGHTVQDKEPKYGLVVLGFVHPEHVLSKGGAKAGDALALTKPIGFGITATALKLQVANPADAAEAVGWMKRLNKDASELAVSHGVRGGTDITGFSLLGHGTEMAQASGVGLRLAFDKIPVLPSALRFAQDWIFPGGASDNKAYFSEHIQFASTIDELSQMLLFDPQTSGGLLLSVPADQVDDFVAHAAEIGQPVWIIGEVFAGSGITIV